MTNTDNNINLKLTPLPYEKRQKSIFRWTLLTYIFFSIVGGFAIDSKDFFGILPFIFILFLLDYLRRLAWVKYAIESMQTDNAGLKLSYYEKDNLLSTTITWDRLSISKGSTFTKSAARLITIKENSKMVAAFYADPDTGIDNNKIIEVYNNLKTLKLANA
jgi:hypothetical protein